MQTEISREWWKIKVYNEVSEFLKHPCANRKQQLQTVLAEYEDIFTHSGDSNTSCFNEMELTMNNY